MYEDLETIAQLKFGKERETISKLTRTNVQEAQAQYAALRGASGVRMGQHEASIARRWIDGSEQTARSLFDIWVALIKQRNGHIVRKDVDFVLGKLEEFTEPQARNLKGLLRQRHGAVAATLVDEAERRIRAVSSDARRDLEIMVREHEAFSKGISGIDIPPAHPAPGSTPSKPAETSSPPHEKPDKGLFVGIIGSALPLVLAILLANGVDVKWQASIAIYLFLACVCAWSFWKHAVPHKGPLIRNGGAFLFFALIAAIGTYGTVKQYRREHSLPNSQSAPLAPAGQKGEPTATSNPQPGPTPAQTVRIPTVEKAKGKDGARPPKPIAKQNTAPGAGIRQKSTGDCSPNNVGSGNTFNLDCAPKTKVIATPQIQRQTGNPDAPWEVRFTISSTALVQTGDLRLKCTGPPIKAGISRINPSSFSSGNNGPDKDDPSAVVYELAPEMLSPGKVVAIAVYSREPISVVSGTIGTEQIVFPK